MTTRIVCETCDGAEVGRLDGFGEALPYALQAALVAAHAGEHRSPHRLLFEHGDGDRSLRIDCVLPECGSAVKSSTWLIPLELAGACAIAFHTHHEGHPIEMRLDGRLLVPDER